MGPLNGVMVNFNRDARNRLMGVGNMSYMYDALNNRLSITETVYGSPHETRYIINPNADLSQTLIKTDPDGTKTYYVYGLGMIGEEKDGVYRTYHYDRRGSTVALTDENGSVTDTFKYGPYGELLNHTGNTYTPFLYNGRDGVMTDANGLYFMRARYYSPEIKRFLSEDTFEGKYDQLLNINLFEYVNGNPISYIDPNGKWKNKAEQEWAYKSWNSKDYNEMWHLGERWQKEPKNRKAIVARANKIRRKYNGSTTIKKTPTATSPVNPPTSSSKSLSTLETLTVVGYDMVGPIRVETGIKDLDNGTTVVKDISPGVGAVIDSSKGLTRINWFRQFVDIQGYYIDKNGLLQGPGIVYLTNG